MNVFSGLPKSMEFFSSFLIGAVSIWVFLFVGTVILQDKDSIEIFISPYIVSKKDAVFNWFLLFPLIALAFIWGEIFITFGDFLLTYIFGGNPLKRRELVKCLLERNNFVIERVLPGVKNPALTCRALLGLEEDFYTKKSDYYYFLSKVFSALFLSLFFVVVVSLSIDKPLLGVFLLIIGVLMIISSRSSKFNTFYSILLAILALVIWLVLFKYTCALQLGLTEDTFLKGFVTAISLMIFFSYYLGKYYREIANFYLYVAYLNARDNLGKLN